MPDGNGYGRGNGDVYGGVCGDGDDALACARQPCIRFGSNHLAVLLAAENNGEVRDWGW